MSDVQAGENNPFAQGSQLQENVVAGAPTDEPQLETFAGGSAGADPLPPAEDAQFVEHVDGPLSPLEMLDGLLSELEGGAHMSKIEILAIVMKYRTLRGE